MSRHIFVVLTLVLLAVTTPVEGGVVVFDNLGSSYEPWGAWFGIGTNGTQLGIGTTFVPNASGTMDGIAAAIYAPYNEPYEMTLLVSVDSGGQPGSTIWEATYTNQSNPYPSIFSAAVSNGPNLTAGTIYWLVAQSPTAGENAPGWNSNNQHDLGSFGYESDGTWTIYTNTERLGLRVTAETVPEPGTVTLLALGIGLTFARKWALK